jgi:hypothetical protein
VLRGTRLPMYALLLPRDGWAAVDRAGATLEQMLQQGYDGASTSVSALLRHIRRIFATETWSYEPRLSLIPGRPRER